MAKTITREEIKSKDLRREYKRFIGEKKFGLLFEQIRAYGGKKQPSVV